MKRIALIAIGAAGLTLAACNNDAQKTEADAAPDAGMDAAATAPADASGGAMAPADGATGAGAASTGGPTGVAAGTGPGTTTINGQVTNSTGQQAQGGTAPVGATLRGDSPGTATPLPAGQGTTYSRTNDQ